MRQTRLESRSLPLEAERRARLTSLVSFHG